MRDDDDRHAGVARRVLQEPQDLLARYVVEGTRRLVAQEQTRLFGECASDGHALLLTAGELRREVAAPLRESHLGEYLRRIAVHMADVCCHLDVFERREVLYQIIELKDKAHFIPAVGGEILNAEMGDVPPTDKDLALTQRIHAAEDVEQGGFTRAGGADDDAEFPLVDDEVRVVQGVDLDLTNGIGLADMAEFDEVIHVRLLSETYLF